MDSENTYVIDPQNEAELARLILQGNVIDSRMDLLPPGFVPRRGAKILDLACGPGTWALTVAQKHPQMNIIGIDIDPLMLAWAQNQSHNQKRLEFRAGNVLKPLPFPDQTFDLVNARLLLAVMTPTHWPLLIQECFRITKPGGILRMTEPSGMGVLSTAINKLETLIRKAYFRAGKSFAEWDYGVVVNLGLYFEQSGYQVLDELAYVFNQSFGADLHSAITQGGAVFVQLVKPFLQRYLNEEEVHDVDLVWEAVSQEVKKPTFRAHWYLTSVIGRKPDTKA